MAAQEGALYGGKIWQPSALVLYMAHVNPGLPEGFRVHWYDIIWKTPWLADRNHLSKDEFDRFYQEPGPEVSSEIELATEDVYRRHLEEAAIKLVEPRTLRGRSFQRMRNRRTGLTNSERDQTGPR